MQRDLFGRMLSISFNHKVHIEKVLTFPFTPIPRCMCHADGTMGKTDKSQLLQIFEKYFGDNNSHPLISDILVIDGFFMLYLMNEIPQTYDGISKKFLSMITQFQANRIDIIFDQYFTPSIRDCECTRIK